MGTKGRKERKGEVGGLAAGKGRGRGAEESLCYALLYKHALTKPASIPGLQGDDRTGCRVGNGGELSNI